MNVLPHGSRKEDPPPKESSLKFRLALAARKYPVQVALVIAIAVLTVPAWLLISSQGDLRHATHELESSTHELQSSQKALKSALDATQRSRRVSSMAYCKSINKNGRANNLQTDYFIRLAKDARRRPPTNGQSAAERNKVLREFLKVSRKAKIKDLDCAKFQRTIENEITKAKKGKP